MKKKKKKKVVEDWSKNEEGMKVTIKMKMVVEEV